jgi:uncharacterized protein YecT (DUF1311 family)
LPTEGTDSETEVHIQRKEKIVCFFRWPVRILFSLIMLFITWYSFFGKIDFINQHSIFQGNSSTNKSPPKEPNNTQQHSGQGMVSTPTSPPTVIVEPDNTRQQEPETLYVNTRAPTLREGPGKEYNEPENAGPENERIDKQRAETVEKGTGRELVVQSVAKEQKPSLLPTVTHKPSFDCAKATYTSERLVCSFPDLASLDLSLANAYRDAAARSDSSGKAALRNQQNYWLRHVREKCQNAECLRGIYEARINELRAMWR